MKILLTNDDGIYAEGIRSLYKELSKEHEIYVVAPDHEQSATGHAITMHRPLRAEKITHLYKGSKGAWSVNGTPADCVKLAVEALLLDDLPELVISGINRGFNLGTDVLYSGTVSAAIEGAILGLPAVAVSIASVPDSPDFDMAATFISDLLKSIQEHTMDSDTVLNVNLPNISAADIKGVCITSLGIRFYQNSFEKRVDPRGKTYYWLAGKLVEKENQKNSDIVAVEKGFISITPLEFNLTNKKMIPVLNSWEITW